MRRRHGSVAGQLLVALCVGAILIGVAAVGGYFTVAHQASAIKQLISHYQDLQETESELEADFITSAFAAHNHALTGEQRFLAPLASAEAAFGHELAILQRYSTRGLRGLVADQARLGQQWFGLVPRIAEVTPHTAAARSLIAQSAHIVSSFVTASIAMQRHIHDSVLGLTESRRRGFTVGVAWAAAGLVIAILLGLAACLSTVYTVTRPLRRLTATVRRLTTGDNTARVAPSGSAEVREAARSINTLADEADRLRRQEAESNRLRAMAREVGLRIREHLVAGEVLGEAEAGLRQHIDADYVYLRLLEEGGGIGRPIGTPPAWIAAPPGATSGDVIQQRLTRAELEVLRAAMRTQSSLVTQDVEAEEGHRISPKIREVLRKGGIRSQVLTPFGVGTELLGLIVTQRTSSDRCWTEAEVDALNSIAADLGRGLNQARLYEAENRLVEDLRRLALVKSDFFATVSHELRAPLTTIEGYVEMLGDGEAGQITVQQGKMLQTIARSSVRLRSLVEDLLTLSKLESGETHMDRCPVDLGEVIADAVEAVRPSVAAGRLTLECTSPGDDLVVDGDAGQLERVMVNLLSNAVKFTPKGGRIEVGASGVDGSAVIRVRDTGIGIPERGQKELFTRFARASNATARRIPGTGLGLVIVRTIVSNHGGDVRLESAEGAGTTVTVRLPLRTTQHQPQPAVGGSHPG